MKKICVFLFIAGFIAITAQAQESEKLTSKKGIPILPETGDWALGIDASPFFRYAGNMLSSANNFVPTFGFTAQAPGAIYVKYQTTSKMAYRAIILIGASTETEKDPPTTGDTPDKNIYSALSIGLHLGIEKTLSERGRVLGYYGGMAGITKTPYNDGINIGKYSYVDANNSDADYKLVGGNTISVSVGGFAGVEYFFAPKLSIGGEFGVELMGSIQSERIQKRDNAPDATIDYGSSEISLSNNASGSLVLSIYL